jgi:hypothetical protein
VKGVSRGGRRERDGKVFRRVRGRSWVFRLEREERRERRRRYR